MRARAMVPLVAVLLGCDARPGASQDLAAGREGRPAVNYEQLIAAAREDGSIAGRRRLVRLLMEVGRYDEAETAAAEFRRGADSAQYATVHGLVLERRGRRTPAAQAYQLGARAGSDSLVARYHHARLEWERGNRAGALAEFDRFVDYYNDAGGRLTSEELVAVGGAMRYLGRRDPAMYRDALKALDEAVAADSGNLEAQVRTGELFLEKYNSEDARTSFLAVLRRNPAHPEALLGLARQLRFDGQPGVGDQVTRSLATNPSHPAARAMQASLHLDAERYDDARREAEQALAVDSTELEALAVLAAVHHLRGERGEFEAVRRRAERVNPRSAQLFHALAESSARHRRYGDAVAFARRGVAADSAAWETWGILGINLLRTPGYAEARASLETSFQGDPYNVWIKNTLDLLDSHARYRESRSPRFTYLLESGEAPLLEPYFAALAEEAWRVLAERYGYRPPETVRLEVYRRHADFSVRTAGLPGFGALGVSFGPMLVMDSPAARERGSFNWASTLWHEVAHTFTLGVTDNRVPRWLSEGLSVLEERRTGRGWGARASLDFLLAWKQNRLHPVSRLNEGFTNPSYPLHVIHSYYQASLVCEMIERDFGWNRMRALLEQYRRDRTPGDAVREALGISMEELDRRFVGYMAERFGPVLAALEVPSGPTPADARAAAAQAGRMPGNLLAQLAAGRLLVGEDPVAAVPYLERAKAIFPDYGGPDSPWRLLAQVYRTSDPARSERELARYTELAESDVDANIELARLRVSLGDSAGAVTALERANWIHPYDPGVHTLLAELLAARGDFAAAARERQAVVALDPVDRPEALYQLAHAQYRAGDLPSARRSIIAALEIAPAFERAQALLLDIRRAGGSQ